MTVPEYRKKSSKGDFWRAARFLWPYRKLVATTLICALLAGAIMTSGIPAMVTILKALLDEQSIQSWIAAMVAEKQPDVPFYLVWLNKAASLLPADKVQAIAAIFVVVAMLALVGNVIRFIYEYSSDKAVISAVNDIRRRLYDHILHLPLGFFGLKGTSDVTSRLVSDCQALQEGLKICLGQSLLDIVRGSLALVAAMIIDWRLTSFIILFLPVTATIIRKFGKRMRRASRAALQNSSLMLGQVEGSLTGIRVVKSANAERFERRRYAGIMDLLKREQLKIAKLDAMSTPVLETLGMWGAGAVLIFASYLMFGQGVQRPLDKFGFMGLMIALLIIGESLRKLSKLNNVLQRSSAAATRIFETIDVAAERPRFVPARRNAVSGNGHLTNLDPIQREVRFENVTFSYPSTSQPAVQEVSLTVGKGRSIAIVGRNGSGKTTLLAMLPRFYDPDSGRVTIDGVDVRHVTLRSLRRQIGIVTQDSVIFPGTIAQNIAYGLPLAGRDQIESAARRAFAHDFILEKPQGYDTPLDGLGGQLSGGQKQRLNIARAILRAAPILILDEATSQVDAESEHLIQQAIESLMHERTTFVIAHRFSTIISADSIVVMERGRIVGQGQHDQLLRTCETYQQLYERQIFRPPDAAVV